MSGMIIGLDLAKSVFQVHAVDADGKVVITRKVRRSQMLEFFGRLNPCLVGMEACPSAHHWARELSALGHEVRLMVASYVKPYGKRQKNDMVDAEAICEAVTRPPMRFVPIKSVDQQAVLALHSARQGFVKARTAQANQLRGLLAEYGIIIAKGIAHIGQRLPEILEDSENGLLGTFRQLLERLTVSGNHPAQKNGPVNSDNKCNAHGA